MEYEIREITSSELEKQVLPLAELLVNAVDDGASVGFVPPLSETAAIDYWQSLTPLLESNTRMLFAAFQKDNLIGSVQLEFATMPNGTHRAEVMKLLVLREFRRHGIGRALMLRVHESAVALGRSLLIADTRVGSGAENLCEQLGYVKVGIIPKYVRNANRGLDGTMIMYRWLEGLERPSNGLKHND